MRAVLLCLLLVSAESLAVVPHRSAHALPSSNGRGAIAFDTSAGRVNQFLEHAYRFPKPGQETRNFAFDTYPGARVGSSGAWLTTVAPTTVEYLPGTGIVHVVRSYSGVTFEEFDFAPLGLGENASLMVVKATRQSGAPAAIDLYGLFNFHLGTGSPAVGPDAEQAIYAPSRDAFYEWGPSGVALGYANLTPSTHHAVTPNSPYPALTGATPLDLVDTNGTGGPVTDAIPGFQVSLGSPAVGVPVWAGWAVVLASDGQAEPAVDRVRTWAAGRSADRLLADEVAAWGAWQTPAPAGSSPDEAALWAQAQVVLKMAQVTEPGRGAGQLLASLAPGKWNIAWVRDMAYAVVALVRSGHLTEARAAIDFQLGASVGGYQSYVGAPYQVSVVRYFGDGSEEADSNADGPNVEFDGFGLFLWEVEEYLRASGDTGAQTAWWPALSGRVARPLLGLQESWGLLSPDSSIWEVHWNGKQSHFAYTTLTAANGLCAAARIAQRLGTDPASASDFALGGAKARDALLAKLRAPDGTLGQSLEALTTPRWLDAAALEAINFGLVDPAGPAARATLASILRLTPPSGRGLMRNDQGGTYDSAEWVFVDLRAAGAYRLGGASAFATTGFAWNVAQARANFDLFSELHDRVTADYAGEAPMVGFGAGAYALALAERGKASTPSCSAFALEPSAVDAGAPDAGGTDAGRAPPDAGSADAGAGPPDAGAPAVARGCTAGPSPGQGEPGRTVIFLVALLVALRPVLRFLLRSSPRP